MQTIDIVVIAVYLLGVLGFGVWVAGRQESTADYFLGNRDLPWWAVSFSVVATETSTLTVVGIPAVAYLGTLTFLQITFGYLIGRILVAVLLLKPYYRGQLSTAYEFLGQRFGGTLRSTASVTFLLTRLLADGVRLFAAAIPIKVVFMAAGWDLGYGVIIAGVGLATIGYTYIGGIKAVVWVDVVQMILYVGGALAALFYLLDGVSAGWWAEAARAGKTTLISFGFDQSFSAWVTQPYTFITAVIGGGALTMASHGTDHLIVQRLLACRSVQDSQKAVIGSALLVMVQFALFLLVGLLLWQLYDGANLSELGLTRGDEIFPKYIIEELPPGLSGLILAGIVAAAMSTLSSSLNSLASSSLIDLVDQYLPDDRSADTSLRLSRVFTAAWGIVFMGFAMLFEQQDNPVVELGLSIASFTYGGLLGVFLLGLLNSSVKERDALIGFLVALTGMGFVIFGAWYEPSADQWRFIFYPSDDMVQARNLKSVGWPWYTVVGSLLTLLVGQSLAAGRRFIIGWRGSVNDAD